MHLTQSRTQRRLMEYPAHLVRRRRGAKDTARKAERKLYPPQRGPHQSKHDQQHGSDPWQQAAAQGPGGLKAATISSRVRGRLHLRRIAGRIGGPALNDARCASAQRDHVRDSRKHPNLNPFAFGPVAAAVWLWSWGVHRGWSSAHEPPVAANTPCYQTKHA